MKVYFENSNGERRPISDEIETYNEVVGVINKFLDDHDFTSYYMRVWYDEEENMTWFDVGSHTEFFLCDGNAMELDDD